MKNKFLRKITISLFIAITFCMLTMNKSNAMNLNKMFNYDILNKIKETLANVNNIDVDITKSTIKSSTNDSNGIQTSSIEEDKIFYIGDSWMEILRVYDIAKSPNSYFYAKGSMNANWVLDTYSSMNIPNDTSCIVVEFGLNNLKNWTKTQELADKLANDYKDKKIYILQTPHICSGYTAYPNFNAEVDVYNKHMMDYCKEKDRIIFINPTTNIVSDNGNGYLKDEYAMDPNDTDLGGGKIHLNSKGNRIWYQDIINCINDTIVNETKLSEIKIKQAPSKTEYVEGEDFNRSGMKIEAVYSNGVVAEVTTYTVPNGIKLSKGQESVTISYTEDGITKTVTQPITVLAKEVASIKITKPPQKTTYIEGENFVGEGMVLLVTYNNGRLNMITTGYIVIDGDNLTVGKTSVTISYTEGNVTKTTEQAITVIKREELHIGFGIYETQTDNNITYIEKIIPNTNIETFKKNVDTNGKIEIYQGNQEITDNSELIGTGIEIRVNFNNTEKKYIAVVIGDLSGNGKMDNTSLLKLARYNAKLDLDLQGAFLRATDVYKDGRYGDNKDLLKMSRVLVKIDEL